MHMWHLGGCAQVQSSTGIHHLHATLSCSCCDAVGGGGSVSSCRAVCDIVDKCVHTYVCVCEMCTVIHCLLTTPVCSCC